LSVSKIRFSTVHRHLRVLRRGHSDIGYIFVIQIYIRYNIIIWKTLTPGECNLVYTGPTATSFLSQAYPPSSIIYAYILVHYTLRFTRWHLYPSLIRQHLFLFGIKYYTHRCRALPTERVYRDDFRFQYYFVQTEIYYRFEAAVDFFALWNSTSYNDILLRWVSVR